MIIVSILEFVVCLYMLVTHQAHQKPTMWLVGWFVVQPVAENSKRLNLLADDHNNPPQNQVRQ
jgi:hypothetical protein